MGLDDLKPFNPQEKIIEYLIDNDKNSNPLVKMTCESFANETASESPAPGGGSIAAYMGALGAALATMVANLSSHKRGWDDRWKEFSQWAETGQKVKDELLYLVDEDTQAFNRIMEAMGLPKGSEQEKAARKAAMEEATRYAIEVPMRTVEKSFEVFALCAAMIENGNPNSISDAGVGVLCAKAAVTGAYLNVKINASGLEDKTYAAEVTNRAAQFVQKANQLERELLQRVEGVIG
jgi:glutamate formiminotransferase/formiminotetrahydrofolate cyclodeaminase